MPPSAQDPIYPFLLLCNCAACRVELVGPRSAIMLVNLPAARRADYPEVVAARVEGRPYCAACLARIGGG